jgi:hypothetical protein
LGLGVSPLSNPIFLGASLAFLASFGDFSSPFDFWRAVRNLRFPLKDEGHA